MKKLTGMVPGKKKKEEAAAPAEAEEASPSSAGRGKRPETNRQLISYLLKMDTLRASDTTTAKKNSFLLASRTALKQDSYDEKDIFTEGDISGGKIENCSILTLCGRILVCSCVGQWCSEKFYLTNSQCTFIFFPNPVPTVTRLKNSEIDIDKFARFFLSIQVSMNNTAQFGIFPLQTSVPEQHCTVRHPYFSSPGVSLNNTVQFGIGIGCKKGYKPDCPNQDSYSYLRFEGDFELYEEESQSWVIRRHSPNHSHEVHHRHACSSPCRHHRSHTISKHMMSCHTA